MADPDRGADPYRLQRFVAAQDAGATFGRAVAELRSGRKVSHWMWFVFPQIAGLGRSATAQEFAISSLGEARAYLRHPVLGPRLAESARVLTEVAGRSADQIFGSLDAQKLRSSMTLFLRAEAAGAGDTEAGDTEAGDTQGRCSPRSSASTSTASPTPRPTGSWVRPGWGVARGRSGLSGHPDPARQRPRGDARPGAPLRGGDQAWLDELQAIEERRHLCPGAEGDRPGHGLVHHRGSGGHLLRVDVCRRMGQREIAPRSHRPHQRGHDLTRIVLVRDAVQHADQHHRDGLAEVQGPGRRGQDRPGVAEVGVERSRSRRPGGWPAGRGRA